MRSDCDINSGLLTNSAIYTYNFLVVSPINESEKKRLGVQQQILRQILAFVKKVCFNKEVIECDMWSQCNVTGEIRFMCDIRSASKKESRLEIPYQE